MLKTTTMLTTLLFAGILASGCGKKGSSSKGEATKKAEKTAPPLKLVKTELPALKLTMQAPEGAKIDGRGPVWVEKGEVYNVSIQKDVTGATGHSLLTGNMKKHLKKKLVDKPDLQIWTKDEDGETIVHFVMLIKVGPTKYYVNSGVMGSFNRAQIDFMIESARTLAAK